MAPLNPSASGDPPSQASSHAALPATLAGEAEELLSRAQAQAELLRVQSETLRSEAEILSAKAAALRSTINDADTVRASTESAVVPASDAAEHSRSAMQLAIDAARAELERLRTEAMSIRRTLRAEIDAGLADAYRVRSDVERLCAEGRALAAELRLLVSDGGSPHCPVDELASSEPGAEGPSIVQPPSGGPEPAAGSDHAGRHGPPADIAPHGELGGHRPAAAPVRDADLAANGPLPDPGRAPLDSNVTELLRQMWEAASAGLGRPPDDRSAATGRRSTPGGATGLPGWERSEPHGCDAQEQGPRQPPEPLIGSGGWRARESTSAVSEAGEAMPSPPPGGRRRRLRRG